MNVSIRGDDRNFGWGVVDEYVGRYGLRRVDVSSDFYWIELDGSYVGRVDELSVSWSLGLAKDMEQMHGVIVDDVGVFKDISFSYVCISRVGCGYSVRFYDEGYSDIGVFFEGVDLGGLMDRIVSYYVAGRLE